MEKVLIIIPVYNGESFLEETIASCLKQSYSNIHIVIVDDCSTDNSWNIISKYKSYENITIYKNKSNLGLNKTANKAALAYKSDYLLVLGQDDILSNKHVEIAVSHIDASTCFVYGNPYIIDQHGRIKGKLNQEKYIIEDDKMSLALNNKNEVMSTGLLMNYNTFIKAGMYNKRFRNYGEWMLWIRMLSFGKCKYVKELNAYYRRHNNNMTNVFSNNKNIESLRLQHNYWLACRRQAIQLTKTSIRLKIMHILRYINKWIIYKMEEVKLRVSSK